MNWILGILALPFLALAGALLYALILFWPVMLLLGALHTWLLWVPALGWQPTILALAVLYLLIPTGSSSTSSS